MKEIEIKILNSEAFEYEKKYPSAIVKIRNISVCSILSWGKNTFFSDNYTLDFAQVVW